MKIILKIFSIFVVFVMITSCTATKRALPEKYNLDNYLEEVDQIFTFKVSSWEQVDKQSIILRVNWKDYYLLVLRRPITSRYANLRIGVTRTISSITAGFDRILVDDPAYADFYTIEKIYRLKDREQVNEIKERLGKS